MPVDMCLRWESIGSTSTGQMPDEEGWILFSLSIAKAYILEVCGSPPLGCDLEIIWHDHEMGSYPSIGVGYEESLPAIYFKNAEKALWYFDTSIPWGSLKEYAYYPELIEGDIE